MNYVIKSIGDWLLSAWIWNITFDWFHPFFTGIIMFCLLRFVMYQQRLKSLLITATAQFFAFGLLWVKVAFVQATIFGWQYEPLQVADAVNMMQVLLPSISLGIIYAVFQSLFFILGRFFWRYNLFAYLVMTWLSNSIGSFLSYMFIRMIEVWYYVE